MNEAGDLLIAKERRESIANGRRESGQRGPALVAERLGPTTARYQPDGPESRVYTIQKHKALDPVSGLLLTWTPGRVYTCSTAAALTAAKLGHVHILDAVAPDWYGASGRVLMAEPIEPSLVRARAPQPGSLRIAQGCAYDPGSAAYRFHSAINETTKHASAFIVWGYGNPHSPFRQYDGQKDAPTVRQLVYEADVLHCHARYDDLILAALGHRFKAREAQLLIRHYHGSRWEKNQTNYEHALDREFGALRLGARLTLCAEPGAEDVQWLPIAVPVARYAAMRPPWRAAGPFRIAHSATVRKYKGTDVFLAACKALQAKGLAVEAVLIEQKSHAIALQMKATCDAVFDSFWLGIQGSGLEGGAMGMPVIAGDADVKALYEQHVGYVPYTFADDQATLAAAIERLATDRAFYAAETERVAAYVRQYHDYAAVTARYETIVGKALGRPDVATTPIKRRRAAGAR